MGRRIRLKTDTAFSFCPFRKSQNAAQIQAVRDERHLLFKHFDSPNSFLASAFYDWMMTSISWL
jgi:hypothetical protein